MTNKEYANKILNVIGDVLIVNDAIYQLAYDVYLKLGGEESQVTLDTIYKELQAAIEIWDETGDLLISENGTYELFGKHIIVNVSGSPIPNNELWYTSTDGNVVSPFQTLYLPTIVSNTYVDGKGIIKFASDLTDIGNNSFYERRNFTSLIIPNSVTRIGLSAFSGCWDLTSVTLPDSITNIDNAAFKTCLNLPSITIPNSVTNIGFRAFQYCNRLASITYIGTIAQWNNITKGTDWKSNVPATVVHCTDGDVAI